MPKLMSEPYGSEPITIVTDYARDAFLRKNCHDLLGSGEPYGNCLSKYGFYYDLWEFAEVAVPIAFGMFMVGFLIHQFRADIENAFVNGMAGLIKGKRRLNQNVSDTKTRIADKIDKAANE